MDNATGSAKNITFRQQLFCKRRSTAPKRPGRTGSEEGKSGPRANRAKEATDELRMSTKRQNVHFPQIPEAFRAQRLKKKPRTNSGDKFSKKISGETLRQTAREGRTGRGRIRPVIPGGSKPSPATDPRTRCSPAAGRGQIAHREQVADRMFTGSRSRSSYLFLRTELISWAGVACR